MTCETGAPSHPADPTRAVSSIGSRSAVPPWVSLVGASGDCFGGTQMMLEELKHRMDMARFVATFV